MKIQCDEKARIGCLYFVQATQRPSLTVWSRGPLTEMTSDGTEEPKSHVAWEKDANPRGQDVALKLLDEVESKREPLELRRLFGCKFGLQCYSDVVVAEASILLVSRLKKTQRSATGWIPGS